MSERLIHFQHSIDELCLISYLLLMFLVCLTLGGASVTIGDLGASGQVLLE